MKIAFRADASVELGSGHVMRCLALADVLREGGVETCFLVRPLAGHLGALIQAHGHRLIWIEADAVAGDAEACAAALAAQAPWDWLVVDHYGLDARWERDLRPVVRKIMAIDDLADRPHDCEILLDQNLYPNAEGRYQGLVPPGCTQLLGPRYALLRREFAEARRKLRSRTGEVRRILVCFGGSDPHGVTLTALKAIQRLDRPDIAVDIVIGGANPHRSEIEGACRALHQAKLYCDVEDMAGLMAGADLFVGSGGSITWERCCVGLPAVVMTTADNQVRLAEILAERGAHLYMGAAQHVEPGRLMRLLEELLHQSRLLRHLSRVAAEYTDGEGTMRVATHLLPVSVDVRPATLEDGPLIHAWRNHPVIRRRCRQTEEIPLPEHTRWLASVLADPDRVLLIGEIEGRPIGCVRFDQQGDRALLSIFLDPYSIGQGWGGRLLQAAESWLREHQGEIRRIEAEVREDNAPSRGMFLRHGYRLERLVLVKDMETNT